MNLRYEPALVRAAVTATVALLASLGITLPFDLPGATEALLTLAAIVLPLAQGVATRAKVTPTAALPNNPADPNRRAGV